MLASNALNFGSVVRPTILIVALLVLLSSIVSPAFADHPTQGDDTANAAHRQQARPGVGTGLDNSGGANSDGFAQQPIHNPTCGGYDSADHDP